MIVKNEEKVLERCLKSLQPLMNAIPSELIIADTGSTDSTVEIAKKYTDNVFYFEWINDFAAARNSTLKKAKGKWYFFLDADEYLDEDVSEIINFFSIPELYLKYKTLEIMIRNYMDVNKTNYRDACLARFQRINDPKDPVEVIGKIHESIWIRQPLGYFSTILHHTGYCYSSAQQSMNKKNRNMQLMREEYEKNPNDLRLLSHLIDGAGNDNNEKEKYISEALVIAKAERRHLYSNVVYMQAVQNLQNSRPEYCLELCREYYDTLDGVENCVATVAVAMTEAKILSALARYNESYLVFCRYFDLYERYKKDELILTDSSAHPVDGVTESEYIRCICMAALDLKKSKRYDEAFQLLSKFDIVSLDGEDFKNGRGSIREICQDKKQYSTLAEYYGKIINCDDDNKCELSLYMMESTYYSIVGEDNRMAFAKDVVNTGVKGKYSDLMKLVLTQNEKSFADDLLTFIKNVDDWKEGYSEAIYLAVKHGIDISGVVDNMIASEFRSKLEMIAVNHDDFAGYVLGYGVPESFTSNIKRFLWITSMYEKAAYRSFTLDDNRKHEMYLMFTNLLGEYVSNIYNPELLQDEADIQVLPSLHKFGYYMLQANSALLNGDSVGYVREMKKALQNCESMKEIVEFMLERFKQKMGIK